VLGLVLGLMDRLGLGFEVWAGVRVRVRFKVRMRVRVQW
jgi:hypothetical protein